MRRSARPSPPPPTLKVVREWEGVGVWPDATPPPPPPWRAAVPECVLCGSPDHWIRACDKYDPAKHTPKNPRSNISYFPTGGPRPPQMWCLRCGVLDHATSDCGKKEAPVLWPSGSEEERMRNHCCFCGYRGHGVSGCMRRGASLSAENSTKISSSKNELTAIKKSIGGVIGLQDSVDTLHRQMNSLLAWQTDVVNPQLHRVRENA